MTPFLDYLKHGILSINKKEAKSLMYKAANYTLMGFFIREVFYFLTYNAFYLRRIFEYLRIFILENVAITFRHNLSTLRLFGLGIIGQQ